VLAVLPVGGAHEFAAPAIGVGLSFVGGAHRCLLLCRPLVLSCALSPADGPLTVGSMRFISK
jgi:hypothetical protein